MKIEMVVQMNRYFRGEDPRVHCIDVEVSEVHALATLLDPRYKRSGFMTWQKQKFGRKNWPSLHPILLKSVQRKIVF